MKSLTVGEIKEQFSQILEDVKNGETVEIVYGKKRTPVARIVPITHKAKKKKRSAFWTAK